MLQAPCTVLALGFARERTVGVLTSLQVLMNFVLAFACLNERFQYWDVTATFICMGGVIVMEGCMPYDIPGSVVNFPYDEAIRFAEGLHQNLGFAVYLLFL